MGDNMISRCVYKIKDKYFEDFPDNYLRSNDEEKRPCYFCFVDPSTSLSWMIPMSKKVEKYKRIIERRRREHKPNDILHVAKIDTGEESAFLIQDMFPVTDEYVLEDYTLGGNILKITSDVLAEILDKKAKRILNLIHKGVRLQDKQPDVLKIEQALLAKK